MRFHRWFRPAPLGWMVFLLIFSTSGCEGGGIFRSGPATPTAIVAVVPPVEQTEKTSSVPQRDGEPLRFNLPTPGPAPVSLWRPPLYEVPWALGPNDHFYFSRPIAADKVNWPIADYRYGGIFFSSDIVHTGVDIPTPKGTPVLAAGPGKVIWAGYGLYYGSNNPDDPYGLAVTIRHDFGYRGQRLYTVYAHLDSINVVNGQIVQTGDVLGEVGTTGLTTGPHLHFEVRIEKNSYFSTLNPELWLAPPQGWGVLVGQLRKTDAAFLIEHEIRVKNLETGQKWTVRTYGNSAVNSDPNYKENMVLSDLPAGPYEITLDYENKVYTQQTTIFPGAVTYFTYRGEFGFLRSALPTPDVEELLPTVSP
jgi:murein DD-endopeptidase MepM/ murein hydrolase activator NlpD